MSRAMLKEPPVRLHPWVIILLVSVLLSGLGVIYTAGQTTAKVDALRDSINQQESRLERIEQYLQKK